MSEIKHFFNKAISLLTPHKEWVSFPLIVLPANIIISNKISHWRVDLGRTHGYHCLRTSLSCHGNKLPFHVYRALFPQEMDKGIIFGNRLHIIRIEYFLMVSIPQNNISADNHPDRWNELHGSFRILIHISIQRQRSNIIVYPCCHYFYNHICWKEEGSAAN